MGFTQDAYNKLLKELYERNQFKDPDKALEYLKNNKNFKSLSDQLKEVMIKAKMCEEDSDTIKLSNSLFNALSLQDAEQEDSHKRRTDDGDFRPFNKNTIKGWFNGTTTRIKNREDMIRICFALHLSYEEAVKLMDKCGHTHFNARSATDTAFKYCLLRGEDLKTAYYIIDEFNKDSVKPDVSDQKRPLETKLAQQAELSVSNNNQDTDWLLDQLMNNDWDTDESFINFMIKNRDLFTSYSKTALFEYNKLKNSVYFPVLRYRINDQREDYHTRIKEEIRRDRELKDLRELKKAGLCTQQDCDNLYSINTPKIDVINILRLIESLNHFSNLSKSFDADKRNKVRFFEEANDTLNISKKAPGAPGLEDTSDPDKYIVSDNFEKIIDIIEANCNAKQDDPFVQNLVSIFLSCVVKPYEMFAYWLPCISSNDRDSYQRRMVQVKDPNEVKSPLSNNVLLHFPKNSDILSIENSPEKYFDNITLRKTIIIYSYLKYISDTVQRITNGKSSAASFGVLDFMEHLNSILDYCQLGPLYLPNHFDWLVAQSVLNFELYSPDEENDNPIPLMQEVIFRSFEDETEYFYYFYD